MKYLIEQRIYEQENHILYLTDECKKIRLNAYNQLKEEQEIDECMITYCDRINYLIGCCTTQCCCGHNEKPGYLSIACNHRIVKHFLCLLLNEMFHTNGHISFDICFESILRIIFWFDTKLKEQYLESIVSKLENIGIEG